MALINADLPVVAEVMDLSTIVLIIVAAYGNRISTGDERAFRIGFAGWAGVYFLATRWWQISFVLATGKLLQIVKWSLEPSRLTNPSKQSAI